MTPYTSGTWRCPGSTPTHCLQPTSPPWRSARARTTSCSPSCSRCILVELKFIMFPLFNQCPSRILFHSTPPLWGWFTLFWGDFLLLFIKSTKSMTSIISAEAMCLMVVLSVWSWWHPRLIIIEDFSFYSWNYPRDETYWEQSKKYYFVKLWYILIFPGLEFCLHYWGSDNAGWLIGNM